MVSIILNNFLILSPVYTLKVIKIDVLSNIPGYFRTNLELITAFCLLNG